MSTISRPASGGGGAPTDAEYVVASLNSDLSAERRLVDGNAITLTDGGADGDLTVAVPADGIGADEIAAAAAGNALTGGSGSALAVATDGIQTDELDLTIAPTWTGVHTFDAGPVYTMPNQDYQWGAHGDFLALQAQTGATPTGMTLHALDADGTDDVAYHAFAVGAPGADNSESLFVGWDASAGQFRVQTLANGTGSHHSIKLEAGGNTDQLVLATGGDVTVGGTSSNLTGQSQEFIIEGAGVAGVANTTDDTSGRNPQWQLRETGSFRYSFRYEPGGNAASILSHDTGGGSTAEVLTFVDTEASPRLPNLPSTTGTTVVVDGNNQLHTSSSSKRYKTDIEVLDYNHSKVLELETHRFILGNSDRPDAGFLAEDAYDLGLDHLLTWETTESAANVDEAYLDQYEEDGMVPRGFNYELLTVHHNQLIGELLERIETLEAQVAA